MNTIFIIGIFLAFFLQFLLLTKKQKTLSDKILAVWMFIIGISLFGYYIYHLGYWTKYPHLVGITHPIPLLHGPMLFLYTVFSLRTDQRLHWKDYLHFAPALLSYLYMIRFFFFYSAEQKLLLDRGEIDDFRGFMYLSLVGFILSGIIYPVISYRLLGKYKRMIKQNFSYEEYINLNWLRYCIWGIGIIFLVVAMLFLLHDVVGIVLPVDPDFIIYSLVILFVFLLGYFGIRHKGIFAENQGDKKEFAEAKSVGEYAKSGLKQEDAEKYHHQLKDLMKTKKPYLEPKLTLQILADELKISVNYLSQVINKFEGKNFYDFVNEYRIEEFIEIAKNPKYKHYSILALALESGFNSKSSFNNVFKKHTGETPSQYIS